MGYMHDDNKRLIMIVEGTENAPKADGQFQTATNTKKSSADFLRKYSDLVTEAEEVEEAKAPDLFKAGQKAIKNMKKVAAEKKKAEKEEADKKASNVKESSADFFRRYSDIISEAEKRWDDKEWEDEDSEDDRWKDESEDLEEGKLDDFKDKQAAKKEADADDYKKPWEKKSESSKREVKGKSYGGSKQKDDVEEGKE